MQHAKRGGIVEKNGIIALVSLGVIALVAMFLNQSLKKNDLQSDSTKFPQENVKVGAAPSMLKNISVSTGGVVKPVISSADLLEKHNKFVSNKQQERQEAHKNKELVKMVKNITLTEKDIASRKSGFINPPLIFPPGFSSEQVAWSVAPLSVSKVAENRNRIASGEKLYKRIIKKRDKNGKVVIYQ